MVPGLEHLSYKARPVVLKLHHDHREKCSVNVNPFKELIGAIFENEIMIFTKNITILYALNSHHLTMGPLKNTNTNNVY